MLIKRLHPRGQTPGPVEQQQSAIRICLRQNRAADLSFADPRVQVLHRASKQGLGTAALAGFRYAIDNGFEFVVNLDADFSHNPKYIPELVRRMPQCDVAIGSRYVSGGGVAGWTLGRKLMSLSINAWARLCLGLSNQDNSGSFRCYRVSKLAEIDWSLTIARGYAFQEEVLYRCQRVKCRMVEVPIIFEDRRFGTTKINLGECLTAVWVIFALGIQRLFRCRVKHADEGDSMPHNTAKRVSETPWFTIPIALNAAALGLILISQTCFRRTFDATEIELPFQTQIALGVMPHVTLSAILLSTFVMQRWANVRLMRLWGSVAVSACGLVVGQHMIGVWLAFLPHGPVDLSF